MAANTPTLNKLVELVQLVSQNHRMVKDFRFGPLWNMNALRDLMTPYLWLEEQGSSMTMGNGYKKTALYTFKLYCMDRIQKDESNYTEILSDTKFILDTIMTELDQHPLFVELGLSMDSADITFEPVYEETDTNSNGHSCTFTFRFPIRYTPCNVPMYPLAGYTYSFNNNVFQYSVVGVPGATGPQGETGPQGTQGPTGEVIYEGTQGPTGPQGNDGPQGFQGESGPQGFQGDTGPQGYTGSQGETGPQGLQGETGPQGFQGVQGFQGGTGPAGSDGADGVSVSYYKYNARTNTQSPPPSTTQIVWNNATQISSTILYVSHLTRDGVDIDVFLALIKTGDSLILQDENNSNNYQKWTVSGTPSITPNSYVSIPVTYVNGGYSFTNGHDIIFVPLSIGIEGPQGLQGPTGADGNSYVVIPNGLNSVWYNGGDAIDPNFSSMNESYSDGDGLYLTKGNLTLVEDISSPLVDRITITTETITGGTSYIWTIPIGNDTFVGKDATQVLSSKTFTTIAIKPGGITSSKGDIFYTPSDGGNLARLGIGRTGSILSTNNGLPIWTSTTATNSIPYITSGGTLSYTTTGTNGTSLNIVNNVPTWIQYNLTKGTDGATVSATISNVYTDGLLIPANTVGVGDVIEVRSRIRKVGSTSTIINRLYIGVNNSLTSANLIALSPTNVAATATFQMVRTLVVKSATSTEVYPVTTATLNDDTLASNTAVTTYNIDWTQNQYLVSSIQMSTVSDTAKSSFLQVKVI